MVLGGSQLEIHMQVLGSFWITPLPPYVQTLRALTAKLSVFLLHVFCSSSCLKQQKIQSHLVVGVVPHFLPAQGGGVHSLSKDISESSGPGLYSLNSEEESKFLLVFRNQKKFAILSAVL